MFQHPNYRHKTDAFRKRRLVAVAGSVALTLALACLGLRWLERALTFHPDRWQVGDAWNKPLGAEEIWIQTTDGIRLNGWYFPHQNGAGVATIIFFHGNGGNIANLGWLGERLQAQGFNLLLFDYRGYGKSEGESGAESGLYADADAVLDYLISRGTQMKSLVFYGQSLGTAVATDLAARHTPAALILESGFTSASDLAVDVVPWLPRPLHFLGRYRFESSLKLKRVKCPVLITHGEPDQIIPTRHARALYSAANEPKKLMIIQGVGHNVFGSAGDRYLNTIVDFVEANKPST